MVPLPGSKSVTNRALVLAALAPGRSTVRRPLRSRDTELMAAALRVLGVTVRDTAEGDWEVDAPERLVATGDRVDVGNAGTVARFLPPVAALAAGTVTFDGDPRVRERPLGPLLTALRDLGADLSGVERLPVEVRGTGRLAGGRVVLDASQSSQLVSGLLLAAPRYDAGLVVTHEGPPLPSAPHLAMTVQALRAVRRRRRRHHARDLDRLAGPAAPARRRGRARPVDGGGLPRRAARGRRLGHGARLAGDDHPAGRGAAGPARGDGRPRVRGPAAR